MNKGDVGMVKRFSKRTETREELSTTCNLKVMSRRLSAPDATSLPQEQADKTNMALMIRIQVFNIMHS